MGKYCAFFWRRSEFMIWLCFVLFTMEKCVTSQVFKARGPSCAPKVILNSFQQSWSMLNGCSHVFTTSSRPLASSDSVAASWSKREASIDRREKHLLCECMWDFVIHQAVECSFLSMVSRSKTIIRLFQAIETDGFFILTAWWRVAVQPPPNACYSLSLSVGLGSLPSVTVLTWKFTPTKFHPPNLVSGVHQILECPLRAL